MHPLGGEGRDAASVGGSVWGIGSCCSGVFPRGRNGDLGFCGWGGLTDNVDMSFLNQNSVDDLLAKVQADTDAVKASTDQSMSGAAADRATQAVDSRRRR